MKPQKIKIRRTWGNLNPVTRVKESKKNYNRNKVKKETKDLEKES